MTGITMYARDLAPGMLIDAEPIYTDHGEDVPEWAKFELVELTEVTAEDIVSIYGQSFGFAVSRDYPVIVEGAPGLGAPDPEAI